MPSEVHILPISTLFHAIAARHGPESATERIAPVLRRFAAEVHEHWTAEFSGFGLDTPESLADEYIGPCCKALPAPECTPQMCAALLLGTDTPTKDSIVEHPFLAADLPASLLDLDPASCTLVGTALLDVEDLSPRPGLPRPTHPYEAVSPWLNTVYVSPGHRGLGLADRLVRYACRMAREAMGMRWLWLYTDVDGEFGMTKFYEGRGFKMVETFEVPWLGKVKGGECSAAAIMRADWGWNDPEGGDDEEGMINGA
ncbi:hypothetical protein DFJ74DRAFT_710702 [Hyaloraphidium curvatum]|nr:hypothetical protein DFJ74DRAFT_710702 [Hyaloraphidium curvatum]